MKIEQFISLVYNIIFNSCANNYYFYSVVSISFLSSFIKSNLTSVAFHNLL